ncbi:transposase [Amycolatopsis sp. SID8362]|nr:transposase [Amycolatopsis sp. SID8362]NED44415.1 transposase family protein [Amycolatopsis sp. SID8362]
MAVAFLKATRIYGVPAEVLTDNGKQFTGRFTKPRPAEVLFERVCRENGITPKLTKPCSPTTTGKIERWHRTLREELLDECEPFADLPTAQAAITAWVHTYNHDRPHQTIGMVTPASLFRPGARPEPTTGTNIVLADPAPAEAIPAATATAEPANGVFCRTRRGRVRRGHRRQRAAQRDPRGPAHPDGHRPGRAAGTRLGRRAHRPRPRRRATGQDRPVEPQRRGPATPGHARSTPRRTTTRAVLASLARHHPGRRGHRAGPHPR